MPTMYQGKQPEGKNRSQSYSDLKTYVEARQASLSRPSVHAAQGGDAQSTLEYPHERRRNRSRSTSYDNIGQAVSIAEVDEDTEEGFNDSATTNVLASVGEAEKEMDVDVKFLLPRQEWQPNTARFCSVCNSKFTTVKRRHHCRLCGKCVCSACSPSLIELSDPALGSSQKARTCVSCTGPGIPRTASRSSIASDTDDSGHLMRLGEASDDDMSPHTSERGNDQTILGTSASSGSSRLSSPALSHLQVTPTMVPTAPLSGAVATLSSLRSGSPVSGLLPLSRHSSRGSIDLKESIQSSRPSSEKNRSSQESMPASRPSFENFRALAFLTSSSEPQSSRPSSSVDDPRPSSKHASPIVAPTPPLPASPMRMTSSGNWWLGGKDESRDGSQTSSKNSEIHSAEHATNQAPMRTFDTKAVDDASRGGFYKRSTSTNNIPQFFKNMTMGWAGSGQLADPDGNPMPPSSPVGTSSISMGLKRISSSNTMSTSLSAKGGGGGVVAKYNGGLHVQTKDSRALESKKQAASRPIVLPKPGTLFHWGGEHIMDQKGLISFLATSGGTVSWQNPADTGVIKIDSSPWSKGRVQEVVNTQQHARADSWSEDKPGAWFSVSLPPDAPIEPTHYSVRHGYGGGAQMRNWKLLASFDGMAWTLARNHVNDESLKGGYAVHTWSLPPHIGPTRYFRIEATGGNDIGGKQLACSGFEVYGRIVSLRSEGILNPSHWLFAEGDVSDM